MDENNNMENEVMQILTQDEVKKMSIVERTLGVFTSPFKVMENVKRYPTIVAPLIVVFILAFIVAVISIKLQPLSRDYISNLSIQRYGVDMMANQQTQAMLNGEIDLQKILITIPSLVMVLLNLLISTLFSWLVIKIFRGTSKFESVLSVMLHADIVFYVGTILSTVVQVLLATPISIFSFAVLMPHGDMTMYIYNLLSVISIFTIWKTLILTIGFKITNDFSKEKSIAIFFINLLIPALLTALITSSTFLFLDAAFSKMK